MSTRRDNGWVLAAATALLILGCAAQKPHPAENPPATSPPPASTTQAPASPAPDAASGEEPEETITPEANQRAQVTPSRLDPTEEITPQELATIPDPVPGAAPREKAQGGSGSSSSTTTTSGGDSGSGNARETPWSVQIFASEDRGEAQRVARSAADRLQMSARVDHEPPLYKVRLGRFSDEQDAQTLRAQAIRAGYAGAFRVRIGAP